MQKFKLVQDVMTNKKTTLQVMDDSGLNIPVGSPIALWFQFEIDWANDAVQLFDIDGLTSIPYTTDALAQLVEDAE